LTSERPERHAFLTLIDLEEALDLVEHAGRDIREGFAFAVAMGACRDEEEAVVAEGRAAFFCCSASITPTSLQRTTTPGATASSISTNASSGSPSALRSARQEAEVVGEGHAERQHGMEFPCGFGART
jgi:hypothetical protein